MDKKILDISKEPIITSECLTYYKMAVIQIIPNYEEWLAARFKLFVDSDGDPRFGEHGVIYPLSSYMGILNIEDGNILGVTKEDLIPFIIKSIDEGKYVMLDLNFLTLWGNDSPYVRQHETLVYGYDLPARELIITHLVNNTFSELRLPFDRVEKAYDDIRQFLLSDTLRVLNRKTYFTGLTLLSPRYDYHNANTDYDLFIRLEWELAGAVYKKTESNGHCEDEITTGIACVKKLYINLKKALQDENYEYILHGPFRNWCLKISERENVILRALTAFFNKYGIDGEACLNQLKECYEMMHKNVLLFYKYSYTSDLAIVERIAERIETVYNMEKRFFEEATAFFKENYDAVVGIQR